MSYPGRNLVPFCEKLKHLEADLLKPVMLGRANGSLFWHAISVDEGSYRANPAGSKIVRQGQRANIRIPCLVPLLGVARLATGKQIAEAMPVPAEPAVSHRPEYVVPRFGWLSAIGAGEISIGINPQHQHGLADSRLFVSI
jgi:hypothetical protein